MRLGFLLLLGFAVSLVAPLPARGQGQRTTRLARVAAASCLGEVGYHEREGYMPRLDECRAVLGVYDYAYEARWRHRAPAQVGRHRIMARGIRAFSAAVKPRQVHPRPWLLELAATGRTRALRVVGREAFARFLALATRWAAGEELGTPCPGAIDYGHRTRDLGNPGHEIMECEGGRTRNGFRRRVMRRGDST